MKREENTKHEPMTIVTYTRDEQEFVAFLVGEHLFNLCDINPHIPPTKEALVQLWKEWGLTIQLQYSFLCITNFKGLMKYKRDEAKDIKTIYYEGWLI